MPTTNPKNFSVAQPFVKPSYVGQRALVDHMVGQVRSFGDSPDIAMTYNRRKEVLGITLFNKNSGTSDPDVNGLIGPCFGLIWSDFLSTNGSPSWGAACRNKAYARFKNKVVGETSAIGILVGERRETFGMIANRAIGLVRAVKALRRGDFRRFLRELSVSPKRKHRGKIRNTFNEASGLWLEYWFGWSPTVSEMYGLADTMCKDPPVGRYSGSARMKMTASSSLPGPSYYHDAQAVYRVRTGAMVQLTNPDLFLLNSLGLANPLSVLNELVTLSFAVEWFVQYRAVIESMTDFMGLTLSNPWTSYRLEKVTRTSRAVAPSWWRATVTTQGNSFAMIRTKSLLSPTVTTRPWLDTFKSQTRAATAVSLLVQALISLKPK